MKQVGTYKLHWMHLDNGREWDTVETNPDLDAYRNSINTFDKGVFMYADPIDEDAEFAVGWGSGEEGGGWEENFRDANGVIRMDWIADAMA